MIAEALQYLTGLARGSAEPKLLDAGDPTVARFATGDGSIREFDVPAPPRRHSVDRLEEIIMMTIRFPGDSAVWYDKDGVILVIDDDEYRANTVTLTLEESDLFATVRSLPGSSFDHKAFVRLLRVRLAGVTAAADLLAVVRKVKFDNGSVVHSQVTRSRESLGREITSSVSAEHEIPDEVTLAVRVYKTAGEEQAFPVRCAVEADALEGRFRLTPLPDEIERAQQLAVAWIAERLVDGLSKEVPAYHGRP